MEEAVRTAVRDVIPVIDAIGAFVIVVGVFASFANYVLSEVRVRPRPYEDIRLGLGRFLALGLEFQLASDILGTAVSPTFAEIGRLGAIAGIRTVLNYFLAQDLKAAHGAGGPTHPGRRSQAPVTEDDGGAAGATAAP